MEAIQTPQWEIHDPGYYFALSQTTQSKRLSGIDSEIPRSFGTNQVLVRVHAATRATQNTSHTVSTYAEDSALCLSGTVELMSSDIDPGSRSQTIVLKPGTEVYGMVSSRNTSAISDFIITDPSGLAIKPKNLTRAESAAVALSGLKAWQALFVKAGIPEPNLEALAAAGISSITPKQRRKLILVTDAAGETGIYVVQLAALVGLHVVAVCQSRAQDESFLTSLGASEVVTMEDLRDEARFFDYVVNNASDEETLAQCWLLVANDGTFVSLHADTSTFAFDRPSNRAHVNAMFHSVEPSARDLTKLSHTLELGFVKPFVAETVSFEDEEEMHEVDSPKSCRRGSVVLTN